MNYFIACKATTKKGEGLHLSCIMERKRKLKTNEDFDKLMKDLEEQYDIVNIALLNFILL